MGGDRDSIDRDLPDHWFRYHTDEGEEVSNQFFFRLSAAR